MTAQRLEFGYHPEPLRLQAGPVTIEPLPDLAGTVAAMESSDGIENGWIFAPPQEVIDFSGTVRTLPYSARVFGLPKTHIIEHSRPDGDEHLAFHLWTLSFFTGLRLTATEAGFLDATPLKPGHLVDFHIHGKSLVKGIEMAEAFWIGNRAAPERARLFAAAVHALFLGQNPRHMQFEQFMLLYTAFDACFALASSVRPPTGRITHAQRVAWMCDLLAMPTPAWANANAPARPEVVNLRNATVHEALYMGEPLGFALLRTGTSQNLPLEMEALICRLLVGLLGAQADYVRSPVNTRQRYSLDLA